MTAEKRSTGDTLHLSDSPGKWHDDVVARFRANAERCRIEARKITDREERAYMENLAVLWEQLVDAANFRREFRQ